MFIFATVLLTCGVLTLVPRLVAAAPGEPSHLNRRIDADNVAMYTTDYFLQLSHKPPTPDSCIFYTAGLTEAAWNYARHFEEPLFTIWDIWDPVFYNRSQAVTNPLRDILKFQVRNNPDTQTYFRHMSEAYAMLCGGDALVMTMDPKNVSEKGIWGQVEKPTLQRKGNPGGQCDQIDSCDEQGSNIPFPPYWLRPGTHAASIISAEAATATGIIIGHSGELKVPAATPMPKVKGRQISPIAALPSSAWTGAELASIFSDLDLLW